MKFAMITTFFGPHSFGGDAAYVDRLARALLRQGHEVDVIYSIDSFELLANGQPLRDYEPPPGLGMYPLRSQTKGLAPLLVHQTGKPASYKHRIESILQQNHYDVIHFHNISLIGGPGLFSLDTGSSRPLKIMTAHEHWLVCPLSLLWQYKKQVCETKQCLRCTLHAGRPPQLWRYVNPPLKSLSELDALITPSLHTRGFYQYLDIPVYRLPYCLENEWPQRHFNEQFYANRSRSYFVAAGRLVREKGFQTILPLMQTFPDHDLLIAGSGPELETLQQSAPSNVHFIGMASQAELASLFRHAIAVIMPSLFYETFGYVALEAMSVETPVLLRNHGALPELVQVSDAGFTYDDDNELVEQMSRLVSEPDLRRILGERGVHAWKNNWSETAHLQMYHNILAERSNILP